MANHRCLQKEGPGPGGEAREGERPLRAEPAPPGIREGTGRLGGFVGRENPLSRLPSLTRILAHPSVEPLLARHGREVVKKAAHSVLDSWRDRVRRGGELPGEDTLMERVVEQVRVQVSQLEKAGPVRVINATGVVIHTNLGRAPLPERAVRKIAEVASGYSNLEYDLTEGKRGSRMAHVEELLREISGAEAGLVVNNNAAALLLLLSTFARGKEVVISRGELVEIGGSFRIPDIMAESGASLVEVGTTNRTRISDYERAVTDLTALFMKVHRSNFTLSGFTEEVSLRDLVALGEKYSIPVVYDMGSGAIFDTARFGVPGEEGLRRAVETGVSLVTFSGDKLLGGPQAGFVVGKKEFIDEMKRHPLARAVRIDKLCLAGVSALLSLYRDERVALSEIPVLRFLSEDPDSLRKRARRIARQAKEKVVHLSVTVVSDVAECGGGALPGVKLPTWCVALSSESTDAGEIAKMMREGDPPIVGRVKEDLFLIDLRSVFPEEDSLVLKRILECDGGAFE
ncbi:MAG: L-seryl-tRNA(Sec) selenium transferase [Deltaproteobacteria bacterium]|nr:MAG: L-seryl-tRNA(Sec) selenium transferase [Deltaproteobacteria bacterium]